MNASRSDLRWGVKESFLRYIEGLEDGAIETFGGCVREGDLFAFRAESSRDGELFFRGGVRFTGFAGMLDVRLVDPTIEGAEAERTLSALVGVESIAARVAIATVDDVRPVAAAAGWTATARLTFDGVRVFGDVYQVGEELAPLRVGSEHP